MGDNPHSVKQVAGGASGARAAGDSRSRARLQKVTKDFEAILVHTMLKSMRSTVTKSELLDEDLGEDLMTSMFDEKLSEQIASKSNLGIGEMLYRDLVDRIKGGTEIVSEKPAPPVVRHTDTPARRVTTVNRTKESPTAGAVVGEGEWASRRVLDRLQELDHVVEEASSRHGVDSSVIRAVIAAESGGNPRAQSSRYAKGLMQLTDSTAAAMGVRKVFDPRENVLGGTKYLRQLLDQFDGNLDLALASYNAGPGAVEKARGIPPIPETRAYVKTVKSMIQAMGRTKEDAHESD
jgi:Rod binding domain-containing protein